MTKKFIAMIKNFQLLNLCPYSKIMTDDNIS